jgi:cis-L-3-hydroxyproline dehydratase
LGGRELSQEPRCLAGLSLTDGTANGPLLQADIGLSFWGGIDPVTGLVIDRSHPLAGHSVAGTVLAIPSGRGSCTGSAILLELLASGAAPAAIIVREEEAILPLGALLSGKLFGRSLPITRLGDRDFAALAGARTAKVVDGLVLCDGADTASPPVTAPRSHVALTDGDRAMLAGHEGQARQIAMEVIVAMAAMQGATSLIDVTQAHLDCCIHTGPVSVEIAERLRELGAQVKVPTTLNAISADRMQWRALGVPPTRAADVMRQTDAYVAMGARPSFTCAPYLLDTAPASGEQIAWAESNAVAFANSVLGARTEKYPDYLDLCIALTGRAPLSGCHIAANRRGRLRIDVELPPAAEEALYPLLGYLAGELSPNTIPVLTGLEHAAPSRDDLKAFAAAFATTSAAPMFHIVGITPEAPDVSSAMAPDTHDAAAHITMAELRALWRKLNGTSVEPIACVAIGNPHASLEELERLASLCKGLRCAAGVSAAVTVGRAVHAQAVASGAVATIEAFGFKVIRDTCWCMIEERAVLADTGAILTNSGKYVHYGPGLTGRTVRFAGLAACVDAAVVGRFDPALPAWLQG